MGTYGKLMELSKVKQPPVAEPKKPQPDGAVSSSSMKKLKMREVQSAKRGIKQPSNRDTMTPRYHDTTIETIRAAVKVFGKEAATHRFTVEEKKTIRDIVYAYEGRGIRTNENEISRIGVNFLIEDYRRNGENSILHKVLKALNA